MHLDAVLQEQGQAEEAIAAYRKSLLLQPENAEPYFNLGGVLAGKNQLEEAASNYRHALRLKPDMAKASTALSQVLVDRDGNAVEAGACLDEALQLRPKNRLRLALATCLPVIYQSLTELQTSRRRLEQEVRHLREQQIQVDLTDERALNLFCVAYQGLNDRDISREIGGLYRYPTSEVRLPIIRTAKDHFTATLIRLKSLPKFYYRPKLATPRTGRADFAFAEDAHVYACPQSLLRSTPSSTKSWPASSAATPKPRSSWAGRWRRAWSGWSDNDSPPTCRMSPTGSAFFPS